MKNVARNLVPESLAAESLAPIPSSSGISTKGRTAQRATTTAARSLSLPATAPTSRTTNHSSLKQWSPDEQPRERLAKYGPEALATSELIAILLRTGTRQANVCDVARNLLHGAEGRLRVLGGRNWRDLQATHGVGRVKAITLLAALELGRRRGIEQSEERPPCTTSVQAYRLLAPHLADLPHEECWVVLLNNARRAIGLERLSQGGLDATVVDVRDVMSCALRHRATGILLAHNHPSGRLKPSQADLSLTRNLQEAGRLLRIPLQDHLILSGAHYFSFRDKRLILTES